MAANFSVSYTFTEMYFGPGDLFDFDISIKNNGAATEIPITVGLVLSKDKVYGNADDIKYLGYNVQLPLAAGATNTISNQASPQEEWASGDYYIATVVDEFGSTTDGNGTPASVTFSEKAVAHMVNDALPNVSVPTILGSSGDDRIALYQNFANVIVVNNGVAKFKDWSDIDSIFIDGGAGNDRIVALAQPGENAFSRPLAITGAGGNDTIIGGDANDELSGANGKDRIFGGGGNDYLLGGASNDQLRGEAGNDTMSGAGGNDRLIDVSGHDYFLGGAGNDVITSRDTVNDFDNRFDTVSGGSGTDSAQVDDDDLLASIENILA